MYLNKIQLALSPQTYLNKLSLIGSNGNRLNKSFTWFDANFNWYDVGSESLPPQTNLTAWFDANFMWYDVEREIPEPIPPQTNLLTSDNLEIYASDNLLVETE